MKLSATVACESSYDSTTSQAAAGTRGHAVFAYGIRR